MKEAEPRIPHMNPAPLQLEWQKEWLLQLSETKPSTTCLVSEHDTGVLQLTRESLQGSVEAMLAYMEHAGGWGGSTWQDVWRDFIGKGSTGAYPSSTLIRQSVVHLSSSMHCTR